MGKKKSASKLAILFLVGMAVSLVAFFLPMLNNLGKPNGLKFIDFDNFGFVTIGALCMLIGTVLGTVVAVLDLLKVKVPSKKLLSFIAIALAVAGVLILVIGFASGNGIYKAVGKSLFKHATYGFYMYVAGVIVAILGLVL